MWGREEEPTRWKQGRKRGRRYGEGRRREEDGLLGRASEELERGGRKKEATVWREREVEEKETGSKLTAVGEGREWWWGHVTWHVPLPLPARAHRESQSLP